MDGYKINTEPYDYTAETEIIKDGQFIIDESTGEPKRESKTQSVAVRMHLPLMLQQSQIGSSVNQRDEEFDLYELGLISMKLQESKLYCIVTKEEHERLKKRVKFISKFLNAKFFEMVRRVMEAEKVGLTEKKEAKNVAVSTE